MYGHASLFGCSWLTIGSTLHRELRATLARQHTAAVSTDDHFSIRHIEFRRVGGWLPQHISDRGGSGRDHEDCWLEDGVDSIVQNRGHL